LPATPEEIETIVDEIVVDGVANVTVDGQSVSVLDPLKVQEIADRRRTATALEGPRSAFNLLRPARAVFRGPSE
jgi:hypothetical protein